MFVILWEFQVKPGFEDEFARVYGTDGDWARLFRQSETYRDTRLSRDFDRDALVLHARYVGISEELRRFSRAACR